MGNITEIKKGHTGYGLLIENDGFIKLPESELNLIKESPYDNGSDGNKEICPCPFIVPAVFQKFGIKNANGRIYPEDVLKREVEAYQEKIKEKYSYGECYTPDVKVLTNDGWKTLSNIEKGELILTLNPSSKKIEICPVYNVVKHSYKGKMLRIKGNNIDELVTPNHEFPIFDYNGTFKGFYTAQNIKEGLVPDQEHSSLWANGKWEGINIDTIKIKGCQSKGKYKNSLDIPTSIFMSFMGAYLALGHCQSTKMDVRILHNSEKIIGMVEEILYTMNLPYEKIIRKNGDYELIINDRRLYNYLKSIRKNNEKYIYPEIKQLSKEHLLKLYDWFLICSSKLNGNISIESENLSLDMNEITMKVGYRSSWYDNNNNKELYSVSMEPVNGTFLNDKFITITEEDYDGDVMCLEVNNHIWYVMSNGKCHWTKNCNHPESATIDLGRLAMNIVELHWEGHTLVGKMEIITTPGFRKFGISSTYGDQIANLLLQGYKIGVSSRGLGNVEEKYGTTIVTDYTLVCWDIVSDPSTPNAWIGKSDEEIQTYVEKKESKGNIINELSKYDEWLLK